MSTVIKSQDPCPLCLLQNKVINHLQNRPGQFFSNCAAGHKFEDTEELNILRANARQRFPNVYKGLEPPKPELPDPSLIASQDIVITAEMKKTIEEICGVSFTGAADLKGMIFAYVQDNKDKEDEIKDLRRKVAHGGRNSSGPGLRPITLRPDQMIVTLPEWAIDGGIAENAEHSGMTPEEWVNQQFEGWLEQFFTTQIPNRR